MVDRFVVPLHQTFALASEVARTSVLTWPGGSVVLPWHHARHLARLLRAHYLPEICVTRRRIPGGEQVRWHWTDLHGRTISDSALAEDLPLRGHFEIRTPYYANVSATTEQGFTFQSSSVHDLRDHDYLLSKTDPSIITFIRRKRFGKPKSTAQRSSH
ncbi:hypothetical protein GCM10008957_30620 [Deinococcus ruber]|uniref:Uncharacterized protein n=1 Tax=Deinococcus ruber TaxID=1848197 RepID=A0A918CBQ7_9DEIO|nr:hypothetical protein GCM10008957_30620 [Deinococcus ruber]